MRVHHALAVAIPLILGANFAHASEANDICLGMAKDENNYNEKTDAACACTAEKIGDDAALQQNLKDAAAKAPGAERESVYSPEVLAIFDACGPWT